MFFMLIFGVPLVFGGLIDPRYPDYIVHPLVPCESDGYFEHPRNCSWFYRCHSNENITGYYHRDYFECAPGTAFSQDSSICDVGSWKNCIEPTPNCDSCEIANVNVEDGLCDFFELCPDLDNKSLKYGVKLCPKPKYGCEGCSHLSACKKDEWLVMATDDRRSSRLRFSFPIKCHSSPYSPEMQCPITLPTPPPPPCGDCKNVNFFCDVYNVCPDGVNSVAVTLCSVAERICTTCPSEKLCPEGEYFETVEETCYPSPESPAMQCPPPTTCRNCSISTGFCNPIQVCKNGANPVSKTYCALAMKECSTCDVKEVVCPEVGSFFVEDDQECQSLPLSAEWQCPTFETTEMTTPYEPYEGSPTVTETPSESTLPPTCDECIVKTSDCIKTSSFCPDGVKTENLVLCTAATKICASCPDQKICAAGERYATKKEKCYSDVSLSCSPPPTTVHSVEPTQPPCTDCYIETARCELFKVCPFGEPESSMRFCRRATRVCEPCGTTDQICENGEFYAMERTTCFPNPNSNEMQCKKKDHHTLLGRDSTVNKQAFAPKITPVIQCSGENLLPQDKWIKDKFCQNYQSCVRGTGKPTGIIELCSYYFECIYDVVDRDWNLVKSSCSERMLFSYEANSCVSKPKDICRVF